MVSTTMMMAATPTFDANDSHCMRCVAIAVDLQAVGTELLVSMSEARKVE
jgi:hypothetical protein